MRYITFTGQRAAMQSMWDAADKSIYYILSQCKQTWDFQQCGLCDQQSLRSACSYAQSDQRHGVSLEHSMTVKLLTKHYLKFRSLKEGCTGLSESTHFKMPHWWKSPVTAHFMTTQPISGCFPIYPSLKEHCRSRSSDFWQSQQFF